MKHYAGLDVSIKETSVCIADEVGKVDNGAALSRARDLSAWLGLVPKQHTTGGRPRLGGISKRGNV